MTPLAATIRDYRDGQFISTYKSWHNGAVSADIGWEARPTPWSVGIEDFPATQLYSDDDGYTFLKTAPREEYPDGLLVWVQTIDLEFLRQNDAWIKQHYNPLCLGCWYLTCQTILKEGDRVGEAYSVQIVDEDQCETEFHGDMPDLLTSR